VTLLQAVASLLDWLLTGFPLESGLTAQLSRIVRRVDRAGAGNRIKKVPPGEAAHFLFGLRMTPKSPVSAKSCAGELDYGRRWS
jgi:hypothetical protein